MKYKVLLIGFGKIASSYSEDPKVSKFFEYSTHWQVLSKHPQLDLCAVVDPNEQARQSAQEKGIKNTFSDLNEVAKEKWDIVVLATVSSNRLEILQKLPHVRAVLCEKPMSTDYRSAENLVNYCHKKGILLQVNFWRRADKKLRELAAGELERAIGKVQTVIGYYGNGLRNNGSHLINLIEMLLGEIDCINFAQKYSVQSSYPILEDQNFEGLLKLKSGTPVHVCALDFSHYREVALEIWGTEGRLDVCHEGLDMFYHKVNPHRALTGAQEISWDQSTKIITGASLSLYNIYENLVRALEGKEDLWSSGKTSLSTEFWVQKFFSEFLK